jgi:hypothetical protein
MPEQPAAPIPQDLADAFRDAVFGYPDCEFSCARVAFRGQGELASAICAMAMPFTDPLPQEVFAGLCGHMLYGHHDDHKLKDVLAIEKKYSTAARCFLQLIESHKLQEELLEKMRRNRE